MGWYIRKSVSLGPIRLNTSKSGLGASIGVRGGRVGVGPRGSYVSMGRGGLYYRQNFSSSSRKAHVQPGVRVPAPPVPTYSGVGEFQSLEGGDVGAMADASSTDLLEELNRVQRRTSRMWLALLLAVFLAYVRGAFNVLSGQQQPTPEPLFARIVLALVAGAALVLAWRSDRLHGVTRLTYELDDTVAKQFEEIRRGFSELSACQLVKHTTAAARVYDHKRNAGADSVVKADSVRPHEGAPRRVQCNIAVPVLPAGNRTLYFFPDRLLIYERGIANRLFKGIIRARALAIPRSRRSSLPR